MTIVNARNFVGAGLPSENGVSLAEAIIGMKGSPWSELTIDARNCPPDFLNSALFNSFWQRLYEEKPSHFDDAKKIRWEFGYDFQRKNYESLLSKFKPREPA